MPFDEAARPHGIEQEYADDGKMVWCAKWAHGVMHGPAVQLDDAGAPLIVTLFVNGRGADIWASCGNITEYRELDNGVPHGLMRWGDMTHPAEEGYYRHGRKHGVFRHWTNGKLDDGFPRFFIDDRALSLSEYEAARAHDASLPAYQIDDDEHGRTVPSAAIEAVRRAQALRGDFQLAEFLEQLENE